MAYEFPKIIEDIKAKHKYEADNTKQELETIDTRQTELKSQLASLGPRQLRAQELKSRDDLICAFCFIEHGIESPLICLEGDRHTDRLRCSNSECEERHELNF